MALSAVSGGIPPETAERATCWFTVANTARGMLLPKSIEDVEMLNGLEMACIWVCDQRQAVCGGALPSMIMRVSRCEIEFILTTTEMERMSAVVSR